MDNINIVSSQVVLEMPSFSTDTHSMSSSPLINSFVKIDCSRLHQTSIWAAVSIHPHYGVVSRHEAARRPTADLVIHRTEIYRLFGGQRWGARKSGVSWCTLSSGYLEKYAFSLLHCVIGRNCSMELVLRTLRVLRVTSHSPATRTSCLALRKVRKMAPTCILLNLTRRAINDDY